MAAIDYSTLTDAISALTSKLDVILTLGLGILLVFFSLRVMRKSLSAVFGWRL